MSNEHYINFSEAELKEIEQKEMYVYRIFPFDRFIDLIRPSGTNALVIPETWDDTYENPFKEMVTDTDTNTQLYGSISNHDPEKRFPRTYAQCWSTQKESDAMWRIYSEDKKGVLIKARVDILYASLQEFLYSQREGRQPIVDMKQHLFIGKVKYLPEPEIRDLFEDSAFIKSALLDLRKGAETLLYKRDSFEHENEVRVILINHDLPGDFDKNSLLVKIYSFTIEAKALIKEIILDPRLKKEAYERQKAIIEAIGYKGTISKSSIYDTPKFVLQTSGIIPK